MKVPPAAVIRPSTMLALSVLSFIPSPP